MKCGDECRECGKIWTKEDQEKLEKECEFSVGPILTNTKEVK